MNFNSKYLPKSDVVFTVMFVNKDLCEKTLNVILGENIELIDTMVESKNDLHQAALNSIYFDVKTQAKDGRIITLDLQRKYDKNRIRNRTVYYACREIASQKVHKSKYEDLKSVIITFLLTEATLKPTTDNSSIRLHNDKTGEIYSNLLSIHEVNIKHISDNNKLEMQVLKSFFEIESQQAIDNFIKNYNNTSFGALLLKHYMSAIQDTSLLDILGEEEKFMIRLSEEERLEERQEGWQEGLKEGLQEGLQEGRQEGRLQVAKWMLKDGLSLDTISKYTGLSEQEIKNII